MTTVYKFKAYYTDSGVGTVQDPAPTCTVINMADDTKLADAQATTASTNMPGLYSYEYSGADGLDVVAFFATTDTGCDVKQLASYVSEKITTNLNADVAGVETKLDTVDANVDAILADTGTDGVLVSSGTGAKQISLDAGKVLLQATQTGVTIPTVTTITNGVTLADDAITASKFDETTAFPVKSADTGATAIARVGADSDTLETLSDQIDGIAASAIANAVWGVDLTNYNGADEAGGEIEGWLTAIKAKTDNLPSDPADDSDLDTAIAAVKSVVDAVKLKTDNLPADPADDSDIDSQLAAIKADTAAILTDTGTTLDGNITAILADTNELQTDWANGGRLDLILDTAASATGSGSSANTYTVTSGGLPLSGVHVWATTDLAGANIVASSYTNDLGQVTFMLDSGTTYYIWKQKQGYNFSNPDVEVAT